MPVSIPLIQQAAAASLMGHVVNNINTTLVGNQVHTGIYFAYSYRSGAAGPTRMERQLSGQTAPGIHAMLNTHMGYKSQHRLTLQDTLRFTCTPAGGQVVFGFYEHVT